jgi:enoyl-CoA hydratase/carnithine racemase
VDIPAALTPGMMSLIRTKVPHPILFRNMIIQAHRVAAQEALALGLVDQAVPNLEALLPAAIQLGRKWAPKANAKQIYGYLKEEMYKEASDNLKSGRLAFVSNGTGIPDIPSSKL